MHVPSPTSLHLDTPLPINTSLHDTNHPVTPAQMPRHADNPQHLADQVHLSCTNNVPIAGRSQAALVLYSQSGQIPAPASAPALDRLVPPATVTSSARRHKRSVATDETNQPQLSRSGRYRAGIADQQDARIAPLISALCTSNAAVNTILAMQPSFFAVMSESLKKKLAQAFPHLVAANTSTSIPAAATVAANGPASPTHISADPPPRTINLDGIYLNTFHEDRRGHRNQNGTYTIDTLRYQKSSQTLTTALRAYLQAPVKPIYNANQMGIFATPNATAVCQQLGTAEAFATVMNDVRLQSLHTYQHALYHFWTTAATPDSKSPLTLLSEIRNTQLQTESALHFADRILSASGKALLDDLRQPAFGTDAPSVFSIALKRAHFTDDIPLSGAFIVTRPSLEQPTENPAILYLPGHGIEEFTTFAELQESLRQRFNDKSRRELLLPYIARKDIEQVRSMAITAQASAWLRYTAINTDVATDRMQSQLIKVLEDIAHDWRLIVAPDTDTDSNTAAAAGNHDHTTSLAARMDSTATLDHLFAPAGMMQHRQQKISRQRTEQNQALQQRLDTQQQIEQQQKLLQQRRRQAQKNLATWLKPLNAADQATWLEALQNYHAARQRAAVSGLPAASEYGNKAFLDSYAKQQLQQRIQTDHGIHADPDDIVITTTHGEITAFPLSQSAYSSREQRERIGPVITRHTTKKTLSQIALDNIGKLDLNYWSTAAVWTADGKRHPQLTPDYVKQIVRDLSIGQSYPDFLKNTLLTSPEGQARKERYVALLAAQMQLDAREAQISGDLADSSQAPAVTWTQRVLVAPDDDQRPHVNDTFIDIHQLQIDGIAIRGVLVISPHQINRHDLRHANLQNALMIPPRHSRPVILYTPDAPDGKRFRQYANSDAMQVQLPSLHDYLTPRAPLAQQSEIGRALAKNLLDSTTNKVAIKGNFMEQLYAAEVEHAIANVGSQSISTAAMNRQTAWNTVTTVLGAFSFVLPVKITLPLALGRSMMSVWNGFEALNRQDKDAAITEFIAAATHVLDAAFDAGGARLVRSSWHRRPSSLPATLNTNAALKTMPSGLILRTDGDFQGVFEKISTAGSPTKFYIKESGHAYLVRYDHDLSTWRLIDARRPDAFYHDPIRKNALGHWEIVTDIGLPGGGNITSSWQQGPVIAPLKIKQINLPMDGIIENSLPHRYAVQGYNIRLPNHDIQAVIYDADLSSWRCLLDNGNAGNPVWRIKKDVWTSGPATEFLRLKHALPKATTFKKINLVDFPDIPPATTIPKQIHYIWNGDAMPDNLMNNIAGNVRNSTGFTSIVHVDANHQDIFNQLQRDLLAKVTAIDPTHDLQVRNLHGNDFFETFKKTEVGDMYQFFRQGHGKNYSAATDALRYKLLEKHGGIYLDTDDSIVRTVTQKNLLAGAADILLNTPVMHADTGFSGYNTSNFASQADNPLLENISNEMLKRFNANKHYFDHRPYLTNTTEKAFAIYQKRIFETIGPAMFNDVLKKQIPHYYDLLEYATGFDHAGIVSADYEARLEQWEHHYLPFSRSSFEVNIGSEQSITHT